MAKHWTRAQRDLFDEGAPGMKLGATERAKAMENPTMRGPIENASKRYRALAEKFERARRR